MKPVGYIPSSDSPNTISVLTAGPGIRSSFRFHNHSPFGATIVTLVFHFVQLARSLFPFTFDDYYSMPLHAFVLLYLEVEWKYSKLSDSN